MQREKIQLWIRILAPLITISLFGVLVYITNKFREPTGFAWYGVLFAFSSVYLLSEAFIRISRKLDKRMPWSEKFKKRLLYQLLFTLLTGVLLFNFSFIIMNYYENVVYNFKNPLGWGHIYFATLTALILSMFINAFQITFIVTYQLQESRLEAEKFKKESIIANLENLKNQIDPHFLFNNFSTLYSLIHEDKDKAGEYLLQLAEVYRSVLGNLEKEKITIKEELKFLKPYTQLLKVRYGDNIQLKQSINPDFQDNSVAPFAFQVLVENAIKHNIIDKDHILGITFAINNEHEIEVSNNLQPRSTIPESNKIGLKNLSERYQFLSGKDIKIHKNKEKFIVSLPLI